MNLRSLLPQETQRRLKLIESLYLSSTGLTSKQVKENSKSQQSMIQQDIVFVNQNYKPFSIIHEDKLYKIKHQNTQGLDILYKQILDASTEFNLLETLLFEQFDTIEDLAESLYTSTTTLYRMIKRIKKALKPFGIKIDSHPLKITGNEAVIRHLFGLLFREKKTPFEQLAKSAENEKAVSRLIEEFMLENQFFEAYITSIRVKYNFYISLIRTANGHFFDDGILTSQAVITPEESKWQAMLLQIEKDFPVLFNERFYRECLWLFYGDFLVLNLDQLAHVLKNNPLQKKFHDETAEFLDYLETEIGFSFNDEESRYGDVKTALKIFLNNENYLYHFVPDYISIIGEERKSFIKELSKLYSYQMGKLSQLIRSFFKKHKKIYSKFTDDFLLNYLYILIVHYPKMMQKMSASPDKINIMIISLVYPFQENFLKRILSENMSGSIEFHFVEKPSEFLPEELEEKEIDLVISTSSIDNLKDRPIFVIEPFPTLDSFLALQRRINEIIEKKHESS